MDEPKVKRGLTAEEVSRMLGIPKSRAVRLFRQGILTGWKHPVTGGTLIDLESVDALAKRSGIELSEWMEAWPRRGRSRKTSRSSLEDTSERKSAVMTRAVIIDDIREKVGFSKTDVAKIVESVFDIIKETAQRGGKVKISGFGIFTTRNKRAWLGRNPKTGDRMEISARRVLTFKPSPVLNASVKRPIGEIEADQKTDEIG